MPLWPLSELQKTAPVGLIPNKLRRPALSVIAET
jgi:hypothetical protein